METKHRNGVEKSLGKGHQGLLNTSYVQIHLAQEGPELQTVRVGKGLWPHACSVPVLPVQEPAWTFDLIQEAFFIPLSQVTSAE